MTVEMAKQLRTTTAPVESLALDFSIHVVVHNLW